MMSRNLISPQIGETFKNHRLAVVSEKTGRKLSIDELVERFDVYLKTHYPGQFKTSLSKSAISSLENNKRLPSLKKLRLLGVVLGMSERVINELLALAKHSKSNVAYVLETSPTDTKTNRLAFLTDKVAKTPLDWIEIVSLYNQKKDYISAQNQAEEGLLSLDSSDKSLGVIVAEYILKSKKAFSLFMQNKRNRPSLRQSLVWAQRAEEKLHLEGKNTSTLNLENVQFFFLYLESIRAQLTATLTEMDFTFLEHGSWQNEKTIQWFTFSKQINVLFEKLSLSNLKNRMMHLELPQDLEKRLIELYLYFLREKDRCRFKSLEIMDQCLLWEGFSKTEFGARVIQNQEKSEIQLQNIPLILLQNPSKMRVEFLQSAFTIQNAQPVLFGKHESANAWKQLEKDFLSTLDQHDLMDWSHPQEGYSEALLLYPLVAARAGRFNKQLDVSLFKTVFSLGDISARPLYFYLRACSFAYHYQVTQKVQDLQTSIQSWMKFCNGHIDSDKYTESAFAHMFNEIGLWLTYLSLVQGQAIDKKSDPYIRWLNKGIKAHLTRSSF